MSQCIILILCKCIENEYLVFGMSQSLEGTTVTTAHGISHPTHEGATALNQLNQVTNDIHITVTL